MVKNGEEGEESGSAPGNQAELVRSYLAFAARALRRHRLSAVLTFVVIVSATVGALAVWPRTYHCEVRLMVQRSAVLDQDEHSNPLEEAADVVTRAENLEALVLHLDLTRSWAASRPPIFRFKDKLMAILGRRPSERDVREALVQMLKTRLWVSTDGNALKIAADWSDGETARRIADAAKDAFLQSRHSAEISVIEEKMSILETHATRLRTEIDGIAQELGRAKDRKLAAATKAAREVSDAATTRPAPVAGTTRVVRRPATASTSGEDIPDLKAELDEKKHTLVDLKSRRNQNLFEAKGKLVDLKLKFTEDHPEVRAAEQRITLLSQVSGEESRLSSEVDELEGRLKRAQSAHAEPGSGSTLATGGGAPAASSGGSDVLPSEILRLLDDSNAMDPAVSASLSSALTTYGQLRSEIRTARIGLDTAQAAFEYRYKIVIPAKRPDKPVQPVVPVVLGAGVAISLLLALVLPVLLELRAGMIVEFWQVHMLGLPVVGELRLPPQER